MVTALSIFGVVFAAVGIWLTVRIVNRRERWAKWTVTTLAVLPVLYSLSFGPACWWFSSPRSDGRWLISLLDPFPQAPRMYWPFGWLAENGPESLRGIIEWYGTRGADVVLLPADPSGQSWTTIAALRDVK